MTHTDSPRSLPDVASSAEGFCLAICHDLRSPLATAAAAVHELARVLGAPRRPGTERYLEIARDSLSKADDLLGALPDLLARDSVATCAIALAKVVAAARDDMRLELELCEGRLRVNGPLPRVVGDAARLRIALRNLVHNAIRHRRENVRPEIILRAWPRGDVCTLTISDNGRGLSRKPNEQPAGLGIGLAIAREAIAASGGTLSFTPRSGHGTVAAVTLRMVE